MRLSITSEENTGRNRSSKKLNLIGLTYEVGAGLLYRKMNAL